VVDEQELREGAEVFAKYKPFESTWWTEGTKAGKYADNRW